MQTDNIDKFKVFKRKKGKLFFLFRFLVLKLRGDGY